MSRPRFQEFSMIVEYNEEGEATGIRYYDQEGCGHESKSFDPDNRTIRALIDCHLSHLQISHEMVPLKRCKEVCPLVPERLRCSQWEGHEGKHTFTW